MTEPAIDPIVFNEICELMEDSLGVFIETYLDNSPTLLEGITSALLSNDLNAVFHNAHQLKGGSGSIGAMQVFQSAKILEEDARDGKTENLQEAFANLKIAYEHAAAELKTHL